MSNQPRGARRAPPSATVRLVHSALRASLAAQRALAGACAAELTRAAELVIASLRAGGSVWLFGNGGSAADAQHWAAELMGRYMKDRKPMRAVALTTDVSVLTATANDLGYDLVFARQVQGLARAGDVVIAISTSGNSPNVLRGAEAGRRAGARVIGFTGRSGGKLAALTDACLKAPTERTDRIQECHAVLGHALCEAVEAALA